MVEEMEKVKFGIVEWTIGNFSCWNEDVHSSVIKSHEFGGNFGLSLKLQLRPKGVGEHLLANIICNVPVALLGAFSLIGPDGSILSSCCEPGCKLFNISLIGPKFHKVVAFIRKKEALHKDRLTLRCRIRWNYNTAVVARTEIATIRASWTIPSRVLKDLRLGFNWISSTSYPFDDSVGGMDLVALRGDSDIKLRLDHESSFQKNVLVFVNLSVLGEDGAVLTTEEKKHMFREIEKWVFWNSLLTTTMMEFTLMLQVKIVPSEKYKHQSGYLLSNNFSNHCQFSTSCHLSLN